MEAMVRGSVWRPWLEAQCGGHGERVSVEAMVRGSVWRPW